MKLLAYDTPNGAGEQTLAYKIVGQRRIELTFLPPTEKKFDRAPVYLIIPGGGWHSASKEAMIGFSKRSSDLLRARGWATVSIDYRVDSADGVDMVEIVSDAMDAGRYLAHFSETLGIDSHRVVTHGHSAGGHLALMLALAPHSGFVADSPFDCNRDDFDVVATAPLSPPTVLYRDAAGYCPQAFSFEGRGLFRGDDIGHLAAQRHRASPIDYITPLSVPTLLVYGTHDDLVFAENSTQYYARCRTVGAPCRYVASVYGGHCFEPMVEGKLSSPNFEEVQDQVYRFVTEFEPKQDKM